MKFRYLILGEDGDVWGTNDRGEAVRLAADPSTEVLDLRTAQYLDSDGSLMEPLPEWEPPTSEDEIEDDEDDEPEED